MKRDSDGRRWMASYFHQPTRRRPVDPDLTCDVHPDERLVRILGGAWICPRCQRPRSGDGNQAG